VALNLVGHVESERDQEVPLGPLLPYEDRPAGSSSEVLHWIAIYEELRALLAGVPVGSAAEAEHRRDFCAHVEGRLAHWRHRYWEVSGVEGLVVNGELRGAGGSLALTERERELLDFLITHPDQYVSSEALMARAWGDSRLPKEQVRNYIGRLRLKLKAVRAPCRISSRRSRGYALVVETRPGELVAAVTSAVALARVRSG